jgi:uncharacterized protein YraI
MKIRYLGPQKSILILAVGIVICWAVAGNASEQWDAKASVRVNLRRNPSSNAVILSIVPKAHKLRIMEKKGVWCKVDVEGEIHGRGWVYAEYIEEILPKTLKTESSSQTVRVEIASGEQKQGIHPSEPPTNARTEGGEVKPLRALSKMEIPMAGEPAHIAPSQVPTEVRTEDEKAKLLNASLSVKGSITGLDEHVSVRNKLRDAKNESNALSKVEIPMAGEPVHVPPAQPPYSGFKQDALGISGKYFSGVIEQGDSSTYQKSLPGEKKKHGGALQGTPPAVSEQSLSDVRAVASSVIISAVSRERKGLINKRESMRPVSIALKLLSIVLSCLVILLLYKKIDVKL